MVKHKVPEKHIAEHKAEHLAFGRKIHEIHKTFLAGEDCVSAETVDYLVKWMVSNTTKKILICRFLILLKWTQN